MYISKLVATNFRSISFCHLDFSPKINLIVGLNGSGKSNLLGCFELLLNQDKKTSLKNKQDIIRQNEMGNLLQCIVSLYFEQNNVFLFKDSFWLRRILDEKKDEISVYQLRSQNETIENQDQNLQNLTLNTNRIQNKDPIFFGDNFDTNKRELLANIFSEQNLDQPKEVQRIVLLKEEFRTIIDSVNLGNSQYFIVKQGKINEMANHNSFQRFDQILEISGAKLYDKTKKDCLEILSESENTEKGILSNISALDKKFKSLQKEATKVAEMNDLERQKLELETTLLYRDKIIQTKKLEGLLKYQIPSDETNLEDVEETENQIRILCAQTSDLDFQSLVQQPLGFSMDALKFDENLIGKLGLRKKYESDLKSKSKQEKDDLSFKEDKKTEHQSNKTSPVLIEEKTGSFSSFMDDTKFQGFPRKNRFYDHETPKVSNLTESPSLEIGKGFYDQNFEIHLAGFLARELLGFRKYRLKEHNNTLARLQQKITEISQKENTFLLKKCDYNTKIGIHKRIINNAQQLKRRDVDFLIKEAENCENSLKQTLEIQDRKGADIFLEKIQKITFHDHDLLNSIQMNLVENQNQIVFNQRDQVSILNQNMFTNKNFLEKEKSLHFKGGLPEDIVLDSLSPVISTVLQHTVLKRNKISRDLQTLTEKTSILAKELQILQKRFFLSSNFDDATISRIKNTKGVHGFVFELFTPIDEFRLCFENVVKNRMLDVVVEDENVCVSFLKNLDARVTFIPLKRIETHNIREKTVIQADRDRFLKKIQTSNLQSGTGSRTNKNPVKSQIAHVGESRDFINLHEQVECDPMYAKILPIITKNALVSLDLSSGLEISRQMNKNVVTVDGDYISKKGFIMGGYQKKETRFGQWRALKSDVSSKRAQIDTLTFEKSQLEAILDIFKNLQGEISEYIQQKGTGIVIDEKEYITEFMNFLNRIRKDTKSENNQNTPFSPVQESIYKQKIEKAILEEQNKINNLKLKLLNVTSELNFINNDKASIQKQLKDITERIDRAELDIKGLTIKSEIIPHLKRFFAQKGNNLDTYVKKQLYTFDSCTPNDPEMVEIYKTEVLKKLNTINTRIQGFKEDPALTTKSDEFLTSELTKINNQLKKFVGFNRKATAQLNEHIQQKNELKSKIHSLKESKTKIMEYISDLNLKKTLSIESTLSTIQQNFKSFYERLSGHKGSLICRNDEVHILIDENIVDTTKLSTGQKTIIALSLIFSIQKTQPSPFYFFDEMDANLDKAARLRVASLIKEMSSNTQYFISTFREEILSVADKFYGVEFLEKSSFVREIDRDNAKRFVVFDSQENQISTSE